MNQYMYICLLLCALSCLLQTAISYRWLNSKSRGPFVGTAVTSISSISGTQFTSFSQLQRVSPTALAAGARPPRERGEPSSLSTPYLTPYPIYILTYKNVLTFS